MSKFLEGRKFLLLITKLYILCVKLFRGCKVFSVISTFNLIHYWTESSDKRITARTSLEMCAEDSKKTCLWKLCATFSIQNVEVACSSKVRANYTLLHPSEPCSGRLGTSSSQPAYRTQTHTPQVQNYAAKHRPSTRQNICETLRVIPVKHSSVLPDDGSHKIRNMSEWFLILCLLNFYTT